MCTTTRPLPFPCRIAWAPCAFRIASFKGHVREPELAALELLRAADVTLVGCTVVGGLVDDYGLPGVRAEDSGLAAYSSVFAGRRHALHGCLWRAHQSIFRVGPAWPCSRGAKLGWGTVKFVVELARAGIVTPDVACCRGAMGGQAPWWKRARGSTDCSRNWRAAMLAWHSMDPPISKEVPGRLWSERRPSFRVPND